MFGPIPPRLQRGDRICFPEFCLQRLQILQEALGLCCIHRTCRTIHRQRQVKQPQVGEADLTAWVKKPLTHVIVPLDPTKRHLKHQVKHVIFVRKLRKLLALKEAAGSCPRPYPLNSHHPPIAQPQAGVRRWEDQAFQQLTRPRREEAKPLSIPKFHLMALQSDRSVSKLGLGWVWRGQSYRT